MARLDAAVSLVTPPRFVAFLSPLADEPDERTPVDEAAENANGGEP